MEMIEFPMQDTGPLITPYMVAYINLYADRDDVPRNIKELVDAIFMEKRSSQILSFPD